MMTKVTWSYSAYKQFDTCPRKYHESKVLKRLKYESSPAMEEGKKIHKAFEDNILHNKALPPEYAKYQKVMDTFSQFKGIRIVEEKLAVTADAKPCGSFDPDVWLRAVPDLVIANGESARMVDWKTGKSAYADTDQLEVTSLAVFVNYPEIKKIMSGLVFIKTGEIPRKTYERKDFGLMFSKWAKKIERIEQAHATGVWNPRQNAFCKNCKVEECEYAT